MFRGLPSFALGARNFSLSMAPMKDSLSKITRYVKPKDHTVYKEGDLMPGHSIPRYKKLYPEYDFETQFFKRQNRGLYGGLQRRMHDKTTESKTKTRRAQVPNVKTAKLWSETLQKQIHTKVTTNVLRTITKEGGLDNYLLKSTPARIKTMGLIGWRLRYDILKEKQVQEQSEGLDAKVLHVLQSGKKLIVGRKKLMKELFPYVCKDNYYPVKWNHFVKQHTVLSTEELVSKLEHYNHDFTGMTV